MRFLCSVGVFLGMALTGGSAALACGGGCGCGGYGYGGYGYWGTAPAYGRGYAMPPMSCCGSAAMPMAGAATPNGGAMPGMQMPGMNMPGKAMPGMDMAGMKGQAAKTQRITLAITGMHCDDCADKVRKAIASMPGVKQVLVDLDRREALVVVEAGKFDERAVQAAVQEAGYGAKRAK